MQVVEVHLYIETQGIVDHSEVAEAVDRSLKTAPFPFAQPFLVTSSGAKLDFDAPDLRVPK